METCAGYNADKYSDSEEDVEGLQTDQLAASGTDTVVQSLPRICRGYVQGTKGRKGGSGRDTARVR